MTIDKNEKLNILTKNFNWFSPVRDTRDTVKRAPLEKQNFRADNVDNTENFVRELIQNALDANDKSSPKPVSVKIKTVFIKDENKKVGISLKPNSKIELIEDHLSKIDLVLIMSVEPGFGGQKFMPEVLEKTKSLKNLIEKKNLNVDIEIDGGINFDNCSLAKKAGANILVSGSTIFKENKGDLKKNIEILRKN